MSKRRMGIFISFLSVFMLLSSCTKEPAKLDSVTGINYEDGILSFTEVEGATGYNINFYHKEELVYKDKISGTAIDVESLGLEGNIIFVISAYNDQVESETTSFEFIVYTAFTDVIIEAEDNLYNFGTGKEQSNFRNNPAAHKGAYVGGLDDVGHGIYINYLCPFEGTFDIESYYCWHKTSSINQAQHEIRVNGETAGMFTYTEDTGWVTSLKLTILKLKETTIYVTHDQTEAMTMADRIVVMKDGFIQQIGSPEEVYNHPANQFVATFIGVPPMNLVEATYSKGTIKFDDGYSIKLSKNEIKAHDNFYKKCIEELEKQIEEKVYERPDLHMLLTYQKEKFSLKSLFKPKKRQHIKTAEEKHEEMLVLLEEYKKCLKEDHRIVFGIRPEDIHENIELPSTVIKSSPIKTKVGICELLGSEYHVYLPIWEKEIIAKIQANKSIKSGHNIEIVLNMEKTHLFDVNNGKVIF